MNLKQALYLRTIAECGCITTAARKLYISQPSLSQTLKLVELEYGLPIFDRTTYPLRLTNAGRKYLQAAEMILAINNELEHQIKELQQERSGRLRLGISVTRALQVLPQVLPVFKMQYPDVTLELAESGSATLENLLEEGDIDLALAALEPTGPTFTYKLIEKESIGILAGKDSPIAKRYPTGTPLPLDVFSGESFVCLTVRHSSRLIQDKLFRRHGLTPRVFMETDSLEVGRRVAIESDACMLLPSIYIDEYAQGRKSNFYPLKDYDNTRHFYACIRKGDFIPQYIHDFIQICISALNSEQNEKACS